MNNSIYVVEIRANEDQFLPINFLLTEDLAFEFARKVLGDNPELTGNDIQVSEFSYKKTLKIIDIVE